MMTDEYIFIAMKLMLQRGNNVCKEDAVVAVALVDHVAHPEQPAHVPNLYNKK